MTQEQPDIRTVRFESHERTCLATLHLPSRENPPLLVMGNGFGGTRDVLLPRFAESFVEAGIAVLAFDYRGFGGSEGPERRIDPFAQVEDWLAAIDAGRALDEVDGSSLGLWGVSLSGGHVVEAAARRRVDAVASHSPFVDGVASLRHLFDQAGPRYLVAAGLHGIRDLVGDVIGRGPHEVAIVGSPDEFALLNLPGAYEGYTKLVGEDATWTNACQARVALQIGRYRPIRRAEFVTCPALVAIATDDRINPPQAAERLVDSLPRGEALRFDVGHFDLYDGSVFDRLLEDEMDFFATHLA